MFRILLTLACTLTAWTAHAKPLRIATDIAPIHSLVSQITGGIQEPELLIPSNASPHTFALRPSQARTLANADIVFWIGSNLTPWLENLVHNLTDNAISVELNNLDGVLILDSREQEDFGSEEHTHHHRHEGIDPHTWLDPQNALVWISAIAAALSNADPENAVAYQKNAMETELNLKILDKNIQQALDGFQSHPFLTLHDAFQYFENRYGLTSIGALTFSDDAPASAFHVKELRDLIAEKSPVCALADNNSQTSVLKVAIKDKSTPIVPVDAIGAKIPLGEKFYSSLLVQVANSFEHCFSGLVAE